MEYEVKIVDEKVGQVILEDGKVNATGMNALLTFFLDLNRHHRLIFMERLEVKGRQQTLSKPYHPKPYSIYAKKVGS